MDVYEAIVKRRSIRRFKDISVPGEALERCVDAARVAPAARNKQMCEYIIVDDEQLLPKVFDTIRSWAGQPAPQSGAPPGHRPKAYIVTLINTARETELGGKRSSTTYDIGLAAENLILTALEQGLGTCPLLSYEENELKRVLNIPARYEIGLVVALGYPDEISLAEEATDSTEYRVDEQGVRHVPKRKLEDILHRNRFP